MSLQSLNTLDLKALAFCEGNSALMMKDKRFGQQRTSGTKYLIDLVSAMRFVSDIDMEGTL